MAKKSHKRSPRPRKENSSCIGGLISMFDFRLGRSTQRLLSDKKHWNARKLGFSYSSRKDEIPHNWEENHWDSENLSNLSDTEADADKVNFGVISIKALMEEEMSKPHHSRKESTSKIEWLKAELELEINPEKSHNDHSHDLNVSTKLLSQQPDYPNTSEVLTSDIDVAAFMVDYCSTSFQFKDNQLEFKYKTDQCPSQASMEDDKNELNNESITILQKAIVDIAKAILRQKSTNSSKPVGNKDIQQLEEFNNALEMLNSNKDLFLKLLGDSNSLIRKHIEDLQNAHIGKASTRIDENQLLEKFQGSKKLKKQSGHHFFRKRERLTAANQSNECGDAKVANKIVVLKPSLVRNQNPSNTVGSMSSNCSLENKEDGGRRSSHFSLKEVRRRFRNAVDASKKEILHKNEISCRREAIESEVEKKSNTKEIQKKNELLFSTNIFWKHKKLEARKHLSELHPMELEAESLPAIQTSKSLGRMLSFPGFNYFSPGPQENSGSMEITEVEDCEEGGQLELQFVSMSNGDLLPIESVKEEGSSVRLEVKFEEMFQPSIPTTPRSTAPQEPRNTDCAIDNVGRPSPISVLERLYFEEVSSPTSFIIDHGTIAERKTQPREPQIDTCVEASGSIDSDANTLTCIEFDEASLFDDLEISYGSSINDPKFLFDIIDEVVAEIKERHLSCTPWVSLINPSIRPLQKQKEFVNEACRRMNTHFDAQLPLELEHAVKKHFDCGTWFNLQLEGEDVVNEIENEILDYLFEETALELWD